MTALIILHRLSGLILPVGNSARRAGRQSIPRSVIRITASDRCVALFSKRCAAHIPTTVIWLTQFVARTLGKASRLLGRAIPDHLATARWGEMEAYFYLRSLGYRIVAKNFRARGEHGEIDLIGWDDGKLCFVEVKTHSRAGLVPPEIAVDTAKRSHIRSVARRYLRHLRMETPPTCRFDVVSVVLGDKHSGPTIRLHKGAFAWRAPGAAMRELRSWSSKRRW